MMTGQQTGMFDQPAGGSNGHSPWQGDASSSDLAREAGLNDIGGDKSHGLLGSNDGSSFETADSDNDIDDDFGDGFDFGGGSDLA